VYAHRFGSRKDIASADASDAPSSATPD
jgi:hypothetical protein